MKSIVIISDTHGDLSSIEDILKNEKVDYLLHLGDDFDDYNRIKNMYPNIQSTYIVGNHDLEWLEPKEVLFEIYGVKIYAVHGHTYNIKLGLDELVNRGKEVGANIVLYGHNHIQKCIKMNDIILINPGSLSESRDKNISGSYTILQISDKQINVISKWSEYEEILGVEINTVKLEEYNPKYKELFNEERETLLRLLEPFKDQIIQIEHVGSTSMPGIKAKPIIDMVIALKDLSIINDIKEILVNENYIYKGPIEAENDRYQFLKGNSIKRDYHIYFTTLNSDVWYDYVLYRNYMLEHPNELKQYEALKEKLARLYPNDRRNYLKHKQSFINGIHEKARKLYL